MNGTHYYNNSCIPVGSVTPLYHCLLDLSVGDVHVIPIDDIMSRDKGRDMVCVYI